MPVAIALLILPVSALADSITTPSESFSLSGLGATEIVHFAQFDPSLGNLTSVAIEGTSTLSLAGSANQSGGGSFCQYAPLAVVGSVTAGKLVQVTNFGVFGVGGGTPPACPPHLSVSDSKTSSWGPDGLPSPYDAFSGMGTVPITFSLAQASSAGNGTISSAGWSGSAELVYTYTPASAVPEPSTLLLFGNGALGLIAVLRRKRSAV